MASAFQPGRGHGPGLPPVWPSDASRPLWAETAVLLGCPRIPVVLGAADSVLGALGLGVREHGQVAYIGGTSRAPVLLPYLSPGEQGAPWDPLLTGAIIGLDLSHGPEHLARGLVNGIMPRDDDPDHSARGRR